MAVPFTYLLNNIEIVFFDSLSIKTTLDIQYPGYSFQVNGSHQTLISYMAWQSRVENEH